jgi:cold shock CspA family protein
MGDKVQSERSFEDILMRENIVTHYLPLRLGPNNVLQEKGIDVWLALEAYELSIYKRFDIIVLVACDGDYVPLVRKLNTQGAHVMLISWDFDYYNENGRIEMTRTSQQLIEEVYHPVTMHQIIESRGQDEFVKNLFVQEKENYFTIGSAAGSFSVQKDSNAVPADEGKDGLLSIILSVKDGYGFIEDRAINNVFFHYNNVENADFNDLKPGMKVRYFREEDEERSAMDASPRYRATKVIVL